MRVKVHLTRNERITEEIVVMAGVPRQQDRIYHVCGTAVVLVVGEAFWSPHSKTHDVEVWAT